MGLVFLSTHRIPNFELWDFGPYPYVIEKRDSEITIDILGCTDDIKLSIDRMEIGAGYKMKEIIVDGKQCTIYFMDKTYPKTTQINSGDYVKYVNANKNS